MNLKEKLREFKLGKQYGYETYFKNQDSRPVGKVGVILGEQGVPEDYEYPFFEGYLHHVFHYSTPPLLHAIILADRGISLVDPDNPMPRQPFKPKQLVDRYGSTTNRSGIPYVACKVKWVPPRIPRNPWDHGCFLYTGEGKGGSPDICQKTGAKVVGWYYGRLFPEKKIAWPYQLLQVSQAAIVQLHQRYPDMEFRMGLYAFPSQIRAAVDELIDLGCQTIIFQGLSNPVYSDFEEFNHALPIIHQQAAGRAKVICASQLGDQPALVEAYLHMLRDQLATLPTEASVMVIFTKHGHPFKKDMQDTFAPPYRDAITRGAEKILAARGGRTQVVWSCDEYGDEYWDPKHTKIETHAAYRQAIEHGFDYALEFPTEFLAENTDLMVFHAMKKFNAFASYDKHAPIPYPDWEKPLVRSFQEDKTTGIYAGCPVGPQYRPHVVEALTASIMEIMQADGREP